MTSAEGSSTYAMSTLISSGTSASERMEYMRIFFSGGRVTEPRSHR